MAEVVVRRAFLSPVIQLICERLASTDLSDYFHEKHVKKLEITLVSINKVLDDAETKQYENLDVKNWVDDIRNKIYEVEQLLDVIATDAAQQKGKIQRFLSGSINRFESRIKVLIKRLKVLAKQNDRLQLHQDYCYHEDGASNFGTSSFMNESIIYGREHEKEEIIDFLLSYSHGDNRVPIISIVGLNGIGKTTLAQLVYNDHMTRDQFEVIGWIHVSKSFNYRHLMKSILKSISLSTLYDEDKEILKHQLQQRLAGKKYLLVLDDVWIKHWNMLEQLLLIFNPDSFRGRMIVTTHDKEVASVMRSTQILHLRQLEESDSWSLFVRHAFEGRNMFEYPNLESIGMKIVEKCGGSPFALKTLGILLQRRFSENEWVKILETDLWSLPKSDRSIYSFLRQSYLNLPSNLKHCFAYCSIFPKGYKFEKDGLIKLWMAQGLLKCCGKDKNEEELGNEFFDHLVSMSFFQQSAIMPLWAGKYYFIMHDLASDLAKSLTGESHLRIEGDNVQDIPQRTRHIWCCLDLEDGDRKLKQIRDIKGLQSLMVEAQGYGDQRFQISTDVQLNLFFRLKYLRRLSFNGCNLLELADEIRNLKLLRYLDLSYTDITSLPNSICMLYNLHTLLLEECFKLTELPSNFGKLINLRHLNLKGTHIKKMPKEIRVLINLEMLTDFVVGEQHGYDIKLLEELNHLKGRLQISGLKNVTDPADAMAANLKDKKHLQELIMSYDEWREMEGSETEARLLVLEALQPNRNLMRLTINDYRGSSFPNWLGDHHLPNLVSLELFGCKHCSQLPPLGQFHSLKKLSISGCHGIENIGSEFFGYNYAAFRSLETLRVEYMSEWKEWLCLEGFPLLQELCLKQCPKLKSALPHHLPCLQKLEIIDCEELEASIPKAANISDIELKRCDGISINELPSCLIRAILCGTHVIESTLEKVLINSAFLKELEVEDFFGRNMEWFSLYMCSCYSLRTLTITGWHSSSLPFALHVFNNLNSLVLYDCPLLESFFGRQLPCNLGSLRIERCPNLMASIEEWGLFKLKSLKQLSLSDDFEIFAFLPKETMLPSSITSLELTNCSNLRKINYNGLFHLTSLESLYIDDCPCLESLPDEGLPRSLSTLSIRDCPLLKKLYQKEQGERRHTISHIPDVTIS
ncbi:putative P-loop containing nucleoside triphosphate hydrolase, leucine-rich repeat domain, L [Medicago truncatula]|uniref:LRR and NB-ARC domain disease resistance protein, putative n=1 Tax=Medicago truncatula TaxID=3880 RepID=G7IZ28_MEDTR|nr:putative disease resistance protein RGA3 [Medicago truncatula]XP_024635593.1 putative disease resistance protein RGA3 [Medicago truncatula]AES69056.1 LRR and NB-ARC domain disease resistance protein, putative [Medicago truncatula]RHN65916.1 putative P-loop containing nucleoside triphosphate hydrolase, leucine-rich repeat domain, L [Medicago truncatula]